MINFAPSLHNNYKGLRFSAKKEHQEISKLYNEHRDAFMAWVAKNYDQSEGVDKEDLYQDAIVAFIEAKRTKRYDETKSKPSTYLFSIAKYLLYKEFKDAKIKKNRQSESMSNESDTRLDWLELQTRKESMEQIKNGLHSLDSKCEELLKAYYYYNLSMEEIADLLNFKNANVAKVSKFRCLQKMRKLMKV